MSRDQIHSRIDDLLGSLSINNSRLSLHAERLSQLDIDVLRKNCIELYENINLLALEKKSISSASKNEVVHKEPVAEKVIEPVEEVKAPKATKQKTESEPKPVTKPAAKKDNVEAEMNFLFQRFSSEPITSIAKAITLVKKFEYQKRFFDGDSKAYNAFINALDSAKDREEAFQIYQSTKKNYTWDNDDLRDELKALMYRKFS